MTPQCPKVKVRESTKKLNSRDFKPVKSAEETQEEAERLKESRAATAEEIAEEMKVPLADRVTPYHHLSYEEQIIQKKQHLTKLLEGFSQTLDQDVKAGREVYPQWYSPESRQLCQLSHIIECDEEHRNQYRNKVEFTIGRRYQDNAVCVGFNTGNLSKGITFVDYPNEIKTNSAESIWVAKCVEEMVIKSGVEPYDKRRNQGFWRLLLYRESKRTN